MQQAFSKLRRYLFREHEIYLKKLGLVFIVFLLLAEGLELVFEHLPVDLYNIKEAAINDIDFTDIDYRLHQPRALQNDSIVLINLGSSPADSIRYTLSDVLEKLRPAHPRVIGIDVNFSLTDSSLDVVNKRLDTLLNANNILLGIALANEPTIKKDASKYGYINLPEIPGNTCRKYYYNHLRQYNGEMRNFPSFAYKIANQFKGRADDTTAGSPFMLRFSTSATGYYNLLPDGTIPQKDFSRMPYDFPAIEASAITKQIERETLDSLLRDKIVLIGWLSSPRMGNEYDSRDKYKTPVDHKLFNRSPRMPGIVIHANAIRMLLSGDEPVHTIKGFSYFLILCLIVFGYLLVFSLLHRIRPILIRLLLDIGFLVIGAILLIALDVWLWHQGWYLPLHKIFLCLALLVEYKMFAFDFYDWLMESYPERTKFFSGKDPAALKKHIQVRKLELKSGG